MLVLFLRTFKYMLSCFFPLKNECASECAQHTFSARHFPSVVDEWLSMPHPSHALHSDTLPFTNSPSVRQQPALPFDTPLSVGRVPEGVSVQREGLEDVRWTRTSLRWVFLQAHPVISNRNLCQRCHQQMADVVRQRSIRVCDIEDDFQNNDTHNARTSQQGTTTTIHQNHPPLK